MRRSNRTQTSDIFCRHIAHAFHKGIIFFLRIKARLPNELQRYGCVCAEIAVRGFMLAELSTWHIFFRNKVDMWQAEALFGNVL